MGVTNQIVTQWCDVSKQLACSCEIYYSVMLGEI